MKYLYFCEVEHGSLYRLPAKYRKALLSKHPNWNSLESGTDELRILHNFFVLNGELLSDHRSMDNN